MDLVRRISLEHLVLSDQTDGALGEKHLVAELDWCAHLAALDEVGMRLEDRIDFLCSGHLFAVEHAAARLVNHPLAEAEIMLDIGADAFDLQGGGQICGAQVAVVSRALVALVTTASVMSISSRYFSVCSEPRRWRVVMRWISYMRR